LRTTAWHEPKRKLKYKPEAIRERISKNRVVPSSTVQQLFQQVLSYANGGFGSELLMECALATLNLPNIRRAIVIKIT